MVFFKSFRKKSIGSPTRGRLRRFLFECLEPRRLLAGLPYGAHWQDTGEFMLGSVVVTPVFLESNGGLDTVTETWNSDHIEEVLDNIEEALDWWVESLAQLNTVHSLEFIIDTTFAVDPFSTIYEPINRRSNDYVLYVNEFLQSQGATTGHIETEIRKFNHAQREKFEADWSFTIFVANSQFQNSQDQMGGQFAPGGSFRRAFAFAGGLFMVVPSTRPASTFAHETGHMFWARDEYPGGGTYFSHRGYYNSRNENAWDNPTPGFVQQPSIMAAGTLLDTAYQNFTSAPATFAQIGWQDSNGNGIFDVLDVPTLLVGTGYWDLEANVYRFSGQAEVQTLPNLNSSGLRNDITLNRVREMEYRFDGGEWQIYSQPNEYRVDLDMEIPVPANATEIEIRARDSSTTVTSNVFLGRLARADATPVAGINGFLWLDDNQNGLRDLGEFGPEGWTVSLVDGSGQPLSLQKTIDPDSLPLGPIGTAPIQGVVFSTIGNDTDGRAGVSNDTAASTGIRVFSAFSIPTQSFVSTWTTAGRRLQASFLAPTTTVSIDAIGVGANSYGRLEAFNSAGQLIGRYTTGPLATGQVERMTVSRGTSDIAYVIASATALSLVKLDNFQYGPESTVTTNAMGQYSFPALPPGQYTVEVVAPGGWQALSPAVGQSTVTVSANLATNDVDFGFTAALSPWQNALDRYDVNDDGRISALDALLVINALNSFGSGILAGSDLPSPPYIDVNGDGRLSALDALLVINWLNSNAGGSGEAEGESGGGAARFSGFQSGSMVEPSRASARSSNEISYSKVQPSNLFTVSYVSGAHIDSYSVSPSDTLSLQCCCGGCAAGRPDWGHSPQGAYPVGTQLSAYPLGPLGTQPTTAQLAGASSLDWGHTRDRGQSSYSSGWGGGPVRSAPELSSLWAGFRVQPSEATDLSQRRGNRSLAREAELQSGEPYLQFSPLAQSAKYFLDSQVQQPAFSQITAKRGDQDGERSKEFGLQSDQEALIDLMARSRASL